MSAEIATIMTRSYTKEFTKLEPEVYRLFSPRKPEDRKESKARTAWLSIGELQKLIAPIKQYVESFSLHQRLSKDGHTLIASTEGSEIELFPTELHCRLKDEKDAGTVEKIWLL